MDFTPDQAEKVKEAFLAKVKSPCPGCGERSWTIANALHLMYFDKSKRALPCISATCIICGNTQFYNALVLGLADVLNIKPSGVEQNA